MRWSLSRLRPLHIALLTAAYWVGLTAAKLGSAILAAWWVSRLPPGHGSVSAGFQNLTLHLTIAQDGAILWTGSTSLPTLLMWVVGPPLLLAITWRWSREVEAAGGLAQESVDRPGPDASRPLPPPPIAWPTGGRPEAEPTRVVRPRQPGAADPTTPPGGRAR